MTHTVVGIVGPKRAGKDTAAEAFVQAKGYTRIGFADAVKEMAVAIDPMISMPGGFSRTSLKILVQFEGWERAKEIQEVREFLQRLGTEGVRNTLGEDSWLRAWKRKVDSLPGVSNGVVVPDVRFHNEAEYLRSLGAKLIRVHRPELVLDDNHDSEREQFGITCDVEVVNNSGIKEFQDRVLAAYTTIEGFPQS